MHDACQREISCGSECRIYNGEKDNDVESQAKKKIGFHPWSSTIYLSVRRLSCAEYLNGTTHTVSVDIKMQTNRAVLENFTTYGHDTWTTYHERGRFVGVLVVREVHYCLEIVKELAGPCLARTMGTPRYNTLNERSYVGRTWDIA